ncbi:MAG: hypothetical protein COU10_02460 [Candidatus Harrisonbacteria bacterium CG10_big_fil_rev_8_21_14_0_10_45_28]|uniref:HTH cro/C1-type domain-containing protein n=1 Tax=Candidatus Harrisonbacteria bacterium CG10_big_fil_rev_8_21_14_0_10_45_28 TaxID=1974586 RepID=A0A2H0UPU5_9BACT|nr:MAG: hypothetical protein COU10_02460 [Candidatus Harrisonbacteria bacterium CG10_big_fil_rev_8_21_14_0_10_45_28]
MDKIPYRIKKLQKKLRLTQAELAIRLGVTFAALNRWVNGRSRPRATVLVRIAELEKTTSDLVHDPFAEIWQWLTAEKPEIVTASLYSSNRAIFGLKLKDVEDVLENTRELATPPALIGAIIGEVGNNAFDHNLGNWPDEHGVCFCLDPAERRVIIADRGQGVLKTLRQVRPGIRDDAQALQIAFTEILSGRAPEDRGNGLKFVRGIIAKYPLTLSFQSGSAVVSLGPNSDELHIQPAAKTIRGCVATLEY